MKKEQKNQLITMENFLEKDEKIEKNTKTFEKNHVYIFSWSKRTSYEIRNYER